MKHIITSAYLKAEWLFYASFLPRGGYFQERKEDFVLVAKQILVRKGLKAVWDVTSESATFSSVLKIVRIVYKYLQSLKRFMH